MSESGERGVEENERRLDSGDEQGEDVINQPYLDKFHSHQVRAGRAGGLARTEAKRAATRRNLEKARLTRWKGREAAKAAMVEAFQKANGGIKTNGGKVDVCEIRDGDVETVRSPQQVPSEVEEGSGSINGDT